jgi:energy-coupling factor transport system permease protein
VSQPEKNRKNNDAVLYIRGETRLHKSHPFNKLIYVLLTGVVAYLGPETMLLEGFCIALNFALAVQAGIFRAAWSLFWRTMLPLALFMTAIHGIFYPDNQTVLFSFFGHYYFLEGFVYAGNILLQLGALLTASALLVFLTNPADLITAMTQAGCPPGLAYLIGSPLQLLSVMRVRIQTIQAAQRARGLESEGNLVVRFRALFPLVVPLVLGSLIEIEQRSIALEIRGFNSPGSKTSWRIIEDTANQRALRLLMLFVIFLLIILRLFL